MQAVSISYQKVLMQRAIQLLADNDRVKKMFGGVDDKYMKEKQAEFQKQYAEVMQELFEHLATVTGSKIEEQPEAQLKTA